MPRSKIRKKTVYSPPPDRRKPSRAPAKSSLVYKAVMFGLFFLALAWMVVFYLAGEKIPVMRDLGSFGYLVAFGLMLPGLLMTMRWR
ncbi:cell division protein CrgA [Amycolatopsis thermoflava]|uniref:cell division protein CrgA n=1 Tax=Amycolatopsis thermoflava TaxID=84480 RepID=UPI00380356F3